MGEGEAGVPFRTEGHFVAGAVGVGEALVAELAVARILMTEIGREPGRLPINQAPSNSTPWMRSLAALSTGKAKVGTGALGLTISATRAWKSL